MGDTAEDTESQNQLTWTRRALKQLRNIDKNHQKTIRSAAQGLKKHPNCQNVKPLTDHDHQYRLRVGRYRVLFDFDGAVKVVSIEEVKIRNEFTYKK